ncbi:hypothetical protein [Plasmodium yoelii yoelii]|uniref:Peptidase M3A/M3B catalytic domain-containing protein n=1 Tax=Plasmodium yoelii yoelii TaxID=73239 RepID=Q7RQ18_PLAYO|nr:hypothetical protein [Plasmodium yoelii yoelii]
MDINFKDYFKIPSMNSLPNTCLISPGHVLIDYKFIRTVPIKNKLFSSSEILTLFHEFGHAYHLLLLSNNLSLSNLFNIPLDYAEFFSHINEHLANNYDIISILSNKTDNNLKISENLFKTIKFDCSRLSNIYSHSIIDYVIHDINPHLFFSNTINNFEKGKNKEEDNLCNFYEIIERYFPYKFSSFYSIHSTSFPYHFSSCYSGAVLSYLFAEIRVLLNIPTNQINLKKNNTLISFQKKFYDILLNNYRTEDYPSIIANLINSKKSGNFFNVSVKGGEEITKRSGTKWNEAEYSFEINPIFKSKIVYRLVIVVMAKLSSFRQFRSTSFHFVNFVQLRFILEKNIIICSCINKYIYIYTYLLLFYLALFM